MIYEILYDWQKKIIDKFKERNSFGLFLDMGLGKTPLSLALAEANNCSKVIVITLNSKATENEDNKGSWFWWAKQSKMNYKICTKSATEFSTTDSIFYVVNYEYLFDRGGKGNRLRDNILSFIKSCNRLTTENVAIILDESHKLKNLQSNQTKAVIRLKNLLEDKCNVFTYLLTGTPFTTGYIDLYSQLKLLGYYGTKGDFIDAFCIRGNIPGLLGWQQPIVGYKNIEGLFNLVHRYAITINSEDVVDLPDKIYVDHPVGFSQSFLLYTSEEIKSDIKNLINKELKKRNAEPIAGINPFYRNIAYPNLKWIAETNGQFWLRARQLSIGFQGNSEEAEWFDKRRLDELKKFLQENEDNYILFYNFVPELLEIYDICEELGYNIDVYCGEIKSLHFYEKYSKLSDSEKLVNKKNIILANFASGSTGMNWQEYNKCIIFSIPLYKDYAQGIKRIHRIGQKDTCIYHIFYQRNWLDYSMRKALNEATDYNQQMFDSDLSRINEIMEVENVS